jgi:threonine dehydrogenase-like Zn-dependent dehydrogenase
MATGKANPEDIITHRFSLERIHEALEMMASPDRNKIVINP